MANTVPTQPVLNTIRDCLLRSSELISSDSARLDVEALLAHVLQLTRTALYTWPEKTITTVEQAQFDTLLQQRKQSMPIAYLTGEREFWSLPLRVNTTTLIPRPDTELLVELALQLPLPADASVLDLGTGTGAIALALASERPAWLITAVDQQLGAVALAQQNAQSCGLVVDVLHSNWFDAVGGRRFAMIVSNPPYLAESDVHLQEGDVAHEPRSALVSGKNGLTDLQHIVSHASVFLLPQGYLVVEHGCEQGGAVRDFFAAANFTAVQTHADLGGNERVTCGVLQ